MSIIKTTVHNVETNEIETRPLTDEEMAQYLIDQQYNADLKAKAEAKAEARAALLDRLGITEDEAKLLLS